MSDIITTLHPENDEETNLYPNVKKENIPDKSIDMNRLSDDVKSLLNSINQLKPSGVTLSTTILAFTYNRGVWIGSDDGHWYYWNGTQYVDGGIYQAVALGDNTINVNMLDDKFKTMFNNIFNENEFKIHLEIDATSTTYSNYALFNYVADVGETLIFKRPNYNMSYNILATYEDGTTGILLQFYAEGGWNGKTNRYGSVTLTKKVIALGLYVSSGATQIINGDLYIYKTYPFNKFYLEDTIEFYSVFNAEYDVIKCDFKAGDVLKIMLNDDVTSSAGINIFGIKNDNTRDTLISSYNKVYRNSCILANDIKYIGIFVDTKPQTISFKIYRLDNVYFRLAGKKYGALGDSITYGLFSTDRSYAFYLANELGLAFTNYGISATCITERTTDDNSMVNRYLNMSDDLDIITVMGGTNDYLSQLTIGNDDDNVKTTFKGALNILCSGLQSKYPNKKIGFITPIQCGAERTTPLIDYVNAIKTICAKYSIPVLDLYHNGGISIYSGNHANGLLNEDDVHPTNNGQFMLTNKVKSFIESL